MVAPENRFMVRAWWRAAATFGCIGGLLYIIHFALRIWIDLQ